MIVLLLNDRSPAGIKSADARVNVDMGHIAVSTHPTKQLFRNEDLRIITL